MMLKQVLAEAASLCGSQYRSPEIMTFCDMTLADLEVTSWFSRSDITGCDLIALSHSALICLTRTHDGPEIDIHPLSSVRCMALAHRVGDRSQHTSPSLELTIAYHERSRVSAYHVYAERDYQRVSEFAMALQMALAA